MNRRLEDPSFVAPIGAVMALIIIGMIFAVISCISAFLFGGTC